MLALSHALAGAAIAASAPNPATALTLALLSHPLLDLFPHWDFNTRNNGHRPKGTIIAISLIDAALGFAAGIILFGSQVSPPLLLATMFVAQLPDWLEAPYHIFDWHFPPFTWVKQFQHTFHYKLASPWGVVTQVAFVLILIFSSETPI
ncbi:MAG: hypothetical protein HYS86_05305 [Candidatus Chisholmbacteria bacterium]|nr:hypothetical protein [Candidatus Chisholmbacteria bacterium]